MIIYTTDKVYSSMIMYTMDKVYDKLSAIGHTSVPRPSQKSWHLLGHPRNLGKVAY